MTFPTLTPPERAALLGLARSALLHRLGLGPAPAPPGAGALAEHRAAFLTVTAGGEPRAALGVLDPAGPLGEVVARLARRCVDGDPRTPPLTRADAASLGLRLAVLGPLRPLAPGGAPCAGREGVAVASGWHRGVLLPSAAEGKAWDARALLKHACLAAGLPARAHLEPGTALQVFEAEEFAG
jgi:AMMECR1 domain-containing protein